MESMKGKRAKRRAEIEKLARSSIIHRAFLLTWITMPQLFRKVTLTAKDGTPITLDYEEDKELIEDVLKQLEEEENRRN